MEGCLVINLMCNFPHVYKIVCVVPCNFQIYEAIIEIFVIALESWHFIFCTQFCYHCNPYWVHFVTRSKIHCICSLPLSKWEIDWDFLFEVKPSIKHVINLEVKNITKPLFSIEVVIFVTYHWKGLCHSKVELKLVLYFFYFFYNCLVDTFYFHKVFIHTQTN